MNTLLKAILKFCITTFSDQKFRTSGSFNFLLELSDFQLRLKKNWLTSIEFLKMELANYFRFVKTVTVTEYFATIRRN